MPKKVKSYENICDEHQLPVIVLHDEKKICQWACPVWNCGWYIFAERKIAGPLEAVIKFQYKIENAKKSQELW